jgi:ribosomal protein S18 acetylase RimI-like enzyme
MTEPAALVGVRPCTDADLDAVVAGWHATNRASYPYVAEIQRHSQEDDRRFFVEHVVTACDVWVAHVAAEPVGMIALEGCWIRHLAVFEPHRRRGIGSRLLATARARSPAELRLFTFQRNTAARRFYEHHGFVAVAFGVSPAPEREPDVEYRWRRAAD